MKNISKLILALLLTGSLAACGNKSIDTTPSQYLSQPDRLELADKDANFNSDLVTILLQSNANKLQSYWSSHDDFGLKAYQLTVDLMGEDMVGLGLDWFSYEYEYVTLKSTHRRVNTFWNMWYEIIATCNEYINSDPEPSEFNAPFYAFRGIAYWHLANFYQATYKGNEDKMAVPLMLSESDIDLPRASVKDVYTQVLKDLTIGVEKSIGTKDHTDMDKYVAAAYLAKVYACMEDWANVEKYAEIAMEGGNDIVPKYPLSWNVNNADVLWGYDVTPTTSTSWASFWSHMDPFNDNYCGHGQYKAIYAWLYDQMPDNDSRRQLYVNKEAFPDTSYKIVIVNGKEVRIDFPDYLALKFTVSNADKLTSDYIFLRVQDPILLDIEAKNELGKTAEAKTALDAFIGKRAPGYSAPSDQDKLRDEIRIQRRIELWGEGNGVWDMKRWKLDINRTKSSVKGRVSNHIETEISELNPNDIRYIHELPQVQLDINKNLVQDVRN